MDDGVSEERPAEGPVDVTEAGVDNGEVAAGYLLRRLVPRLQTKRTGSRRRFGRLSPRLATSAVLALLGFAGTMLANLNIAQAVTSIVNTASASLSSMSPNGSASGMVYCTQGTVANFRWHYAGQNTDGSFTSGSWSGTGSGSCPSSMVTLGPQAMEGDLKVAPATTLKVGYDLTVPGYHPPGSVTINVTNPQVVFSNVHCASGATPTESSFTVTMPSATYSITSTGWYPSGDQSSPLVYEGSISVPNLCPGGTDHRVRLDKGGTFSASIS